MSRLPINPRNQPPGAPDLQRDVIIKRTTKDFKVRSENKGDIVGQADSVITHLKVKTLVGDYWIKLKLPHRFAVGLPIPGGTANSFVYVARWQEGDPPFSYLQRNPQGLYWFKPGNTGYQMTLTVVKSEFTSEFITGMSTFLRTGRMPGWAFTERVDGEPHPTPDPDAPGGSTPTDPSSPPVAPGQRRPGKATNVPDDETKAENISVTKNIGHFESSRHDYSGMRIPLNLSTSIYQTYKKQILLVMGAIIAGSMVYKFSQDDDPQIREVMKMAASKRKIADRKVEVMKRKKLAEAKKAAAPATIAEAQQEELAAMNEFQELERVEQLIASRERELLKGKDPKSMTSRQLLKDIRQREAVSAATGGGVPFNIGEVSVGQGSVGVAAEGVKQVGETARQGIATSGQVASGIIGQTGGVAMVGAKVSGDILKTGVSQVGEGLKSASAGRRERALARIKEKGQISRTDLVTGRRLTGQQIREGALLERQTGRQEALEGRLESAEERKLQRPIEKQKVVRALEEEGRVEAGAEALRGQESVIPEVEDLPPAHQKELSKHALAGHGAGEMAVLEEATGHNLTEEIRAKHSGRGKFLGSSRDAHSRYKEMVRDNDKEVIDQETVWRNPTTSGAVDAGVAGLVGPATYDAPHIKKDHPEFAHTQVYHTTQARKPKRGVHSADAEKRYKHFTSASAKDDRGNVVYPLYHDHLLTGDLDEIGKTRDMFLNAGRHRTPGMLLHRTTQNALGEHSLLPADEIADPEERELSRRRMGLLRNVMDKNDGRRNFERDLVHGSSSLAKEYRASNLGEASRKLRDHSPDHGGDNKPDPGPGAFPDQEALGIAVTDLDDAEGGGADVMRGIAEQQQTRAQTEKVQTALAIGSMMQLDQMQQARIINRLQSESDPRQRRILEQERQVNAKRIARDRQKIDKLNLSEDERRLASPAERTLMNPDEDDSLEQLQTRVYAPTHWGKVSDEDLQKGINSSQIKLTELNEEIRFRAERGDIHDPPQLQQRNILRKNHRSAQLAMKMRNARRIRDAEMEDSFKLPSAEERGAAQKNIHRRDLQNRKRIADEATSLMFAEEEELFTGEEAVGAPLLGARLPHERFTPQRIPRPPRQRERLEDIEESRRAAAMAKRPQVVVEVEEEEGEEEGEVADLPDLPHEQVEALVKARGREAVVAPAVLPPQPPGRKETVASLEAPGRVPPAPMVPPPPPPPEAEEKAVLFEVGGFTGQDLASVRAIDTRIALMHSNANRVNLDGRRTLRSLLDRTPDKRPRPMKEAILRKAHTNLVKYIGSLEQLRDERRARPLAVRKKARESSVSRELTKAKRLRSKLFGWGGGTGFK